MPGLDAADEIDSRGLAIGERVFLFKGMTLLEPAASTVTDLRAPPSRGDTEETEDCEPVLCPDGRFARTASANCLPIVFEGSVGVRECASKEPEPKIKGLGPPDRDPTDGTRGLGVRLSAVRLANDPFLNLSTSFSENADMSEPVGDASTSRDSPMKLSLTGRKNAGRTGGVYPSGSELRR